MAEEEIIIQPEEEKEVVIMNDNNNNDTFEEKKPKLKDTEEISKNLYKKLTDPNRTYEMRRVIDITKPEEDININLDEKTIKIKAKGILVTHTGKKKYKKGNTINSIVGCCNKYHLLPLGFPLIHAPPSYSLSHIR